MPRSEPRHAAQRLRWGSTGLMLLGGLVVVSHFALPEAATQASPLVRILLKY